jgi:putative oxygen-independent coproporphyrinogen III oxidase
LRYPRAPSWPFSKPIMTESGGRLPATFQTSCSHPDETEKALSLPRFSTSALPSFNASALPHCSRPGLYIHVPFCKTKCPYCDFYSITDLTLIDRWLKALEQETAHYRDTFGTFDSLYFGGGTPSLLGNGHMEAMMEGLQACFSLSPDRETTFEVNPDDVTQEKLAHLRSLGVNRLSIGVQSFNDEELRFLKRRHTAAAAADAIEIARQGGFRNIGVDLMYGLPGQTMEDWRETLERTVAFAPAHLSCYQFTLEGRTPFGQMKAEGKLKTLTEDEEGNLFLFTSDFLRGNGFVHYEISNFARNRDFRSRHNLKYWHHAPYLGLGPAAHSFLENKRWWNHRSVEDYCRALEAGRRPVQESEDLSPDQISLECLFLGFRTESGVSIGSVSATPSQEKILAHLQDEGLVEIRSNRVTPTTKGYLVADSLPLLFSL